MVAVKAIEDIEDVGVDATRMTTNKTKVVRKAARYPAKQTFPEPVYCGQNDLVSSIIPGTQKIYLQTWGCTHNSSDSEYMAGQLATYGYRMTEDLLDADLWLLNSCTVKNPAEDHFRNMIMKADKIGKPVVIAGCVPQASPRTEYMKGLSLIGVQQIDRVVEVVEETLKGNTVRLFGQKRENGKKQGGARLDLPKIRRNPLIEIISINTGCLNACTYCKTKHARGDLGSYSIEEIKSRVVQSFTEGVVEIWITSEDTGAYGRDIGESLPKLLWELVKVIPEGCMMRVGMTNPPYILEHLEEIGKILNHPRVYAFMHIPVQAGSNRTLYEMRREYTREDFCNVVDTLRRSVPGVTIATDIICGFPTESDEDFEETLSLCAKYRFPSLFINQFFPRSGTPAARMPQIDRQEIKARTKKVSQLFQKYMPYEHKQGTRQTVLVTEISHDKKHYVGHNKFYEQVKQQTPSKPVILQGLDLFNEQQILITMEEDLMGRMLDVEIYETGKHYMKGKRISKITNPAKAPSLPKGYVSGTTQIRGGTGDHYQQLMHLLPVVILLGAITLSIISKFTEFL